ncbi:hypothetical protein ILFOPFJJ_02627 [Ensifer psoraleae]|nr:hypothetical protein [Sinorhizobium psoraleae]
MVYGRVGRRSRRFHVVRFLVALLVPVILLGSAIAAAEWVSTM